MSRGNVVLVYPRMGMAGSLTRHLPLSLLYAAVDSLKAGFKVSILDTRLAPSAWEDNLRGIMDGDVLLLGISVITGTPIRHALEISAWTKREFPGVPIVWGGPHATFNSGQILDEPDVDFVISGYGSRPLERLCSHLEGGTDAPAPEAIPGLSWRTESQVRCNPPEPAFEMVNFRDIPYHLVADDLDKYGQLDSGERIFSMYSAMGCPYQCAFCSSPAQYRDMPKRYVPFPVQEVVDHVEYAIREYGATYIYFIDDDSFVLPANVEAIIDGIATCGLKVGLGFRGARVSELMHMDDAFLDKLAAAGTTILHVGAESGSPRILKLINKNCTVEDILAVNQKMARHPQIRTAYNWIVGLPGETMDDLEMSMRLMDRMIDENPAAIMFMPNKYRPLPGTSLYHLALERGYTPPRTSLDWVEVEAEGDYRPPWMSEELARTINMMQITSFFIDDKIFKVKTGNTPRFIVGKILSKLYKPFARFRLRHNFSRWLAEYWMFYHFTSTFRR